MSGRSQVAVCLCMAILLPGCFETSYDLVLNPDGSGKVVVEATTTLGPTFGGPQDPAARARQTVAGIVTMSEGVAAWKDVAYKLKPKSELWFKGTAYFDDVSKLRIHDLQMFQVSWVDAGDGRKKLVIRPGDAEKLPAPVPVELTDEEVAKRAAEQKQQYETSKMMAQMMFQGVSVSLTFHLPGKVTEAKGLVHDPATGALTLRVTGPALFRAKDELLADDAWVARVIRAGYKIDEHLPMADPDYRRKVFGTDGDIEATVTGNAASFFDYASEVAEAKKNQDAMIERLGLKQAIPEPARGGFKQVQLVASRFVAHPEWADELYPLNSPPGWLVGFLGELPGTFQEITGGELTKAVATSGEDLLLEKPSERKLTWPYVFSKDKTKVLFYFRLKTPGPGVTGIRELTGTLCYTSASGSENVDLGFTEFKAGATGKVHGARLSADSEPIGDSQTLLLTLDLPSEKVAGLSLTAGDGSPATVLCRQVRHKGEGCAFAVIKSSLSAGGRLSAVVLTNLQTYSIPFSVCDVTLWGRPLGD